MNKNLSSTQKEKEAIDVVLKAKKEPSLVGDLRELAKRFK